MQILTVVMAVPGVAGAARAHASAHASAHARGRALARRWQGAAAAIPGFPR